MRLLKHLNCFGNGNRNEFIMSDNNTNQDPLPEVWRSGKGHNCSHALQLLLSSRMKAELLIRNVKTSRNGDRGAQPLSAAHTLAVPCQQRWGEGSAVSGAELNLKHRAAESSQLLPGGWRSLFWKMFFSEATSQQPLHAGAMLNYILHQLADLPGS